MNLSIAIEGRADNITATILHPGATVTELSPGMADRPRRTSMQAEEIARMTAVLQDSDMVRVGGTGSSARIAIKLWDGVQRFSPDTGDLVDPAALASVGALVAELLEAAAVEAADVRPRPAP